MSAGVGPILEGGTMHRIRTASTATLVSAQLALSELGDRIAGGAQHRLDRLREDPEQGAQAAEYAMLGGVSAAACGGLIYVLRESRILEQVATSIFDLITRTVGSWF